MEQRKLDELHAKYLFILPKIELHGSIYFRHLSPDRKADAIQEMRALACYADHQIMQKEGIYLSPTRHRCGCRLA